MRISSVTSTDLFVGSLQRPLQVVRVDLDGPLTGPVRLRVEGPAVTTPEPVTLRAPGTAEIGVALADPVQDGSVRRVRAIAEGPESLAGVAGSRTVAAEATITAAATGWTMWMVSHFHYDPVWWNTQAGFTQTWYDVPAAERLRPETVLTAFDLVRAHLDAARADPDYRFVLAEIDYLKPHWDAFPEDRADLRRFIREGRVEIVGGNYNEANTNLTHPESTVRNALYGIAFQRDVVGGDPRSAWMLDAFGFDPAYPGLMADAGLDSSAWARGPFHMWGPRRHVGDNTRMQFPAEFEWISPSGRGLLTHYMPNHYGAGWVMEEQATSLEEAMDVAYREFSELKPVASTRNVLLPVGGDHVVPSRWCTEVHRSFAKRYVWPRFQVGLPRDFFAAVRAATGGGRTSRPRPQTRDMNPVYTGKDVSYIDTKQAQRAAEVAVLDGERLATVATQLGAGYPREELAKAWRQLAFGAHHDAITGTESDQVYLDLLGGWREAYELGDRVRSEAIGHLAAHADTSPIVPESGTSPIVPESGTSPIVPESGTSPIVPESGTSPIVPESGTSPIVPESGTSPIVPESGTDGPGRPVVVVNSLSWQRGGLVTVDEAAWHVVRDDTGAEVPALAEGDRITFLAADVPALGHRVYHLVPGEPEGWTEMDGTAAENEAFYVRAGKDETLTSIVDRRTGRELLRGPGAEFLLQEEYTQHPVWKEGPWHLLPKGPGRTPPAAEIRAERSPLGQRLVIACRLADLKITQEVLLWHGVDRVDFRSHVDGSIGGDHLLRVRFGLDLPGARPVSEVGYAAVGRPFGFPQSDAGPHPWTLDNPALGWSALSSAVRIRAGERAHAIGVAEVVADPDVDVRPLLAALAAQGVTATSTLPEGPRYGSLDLDSNLPDVRIVAGRNAYARAVLDAADPGYAEALDRGGRVLIPAGSQTGAAWEPGADLRGVRDLPVLIADDARALGEDVADSMIEVSQDPPATDHPLDDYSVALVNRGTPSTVAEADGTLYLTLMRSCTAWPSGVWLNGDRRTAPDGSGFALQHWSHTFAYSLVAGPGDWREAGFVAAAQEVNHALLARVGEDAHDGAAARSLVSVSPPSAVLSALKAAEDGDGVVCRIYESRGRPVTARVSMAGGVASATVTNLLEEEARTPVPCPDGVAEIPLNPAEVATLRLTPSHKGSPHPPPSNAELIHSLEPAQPVYTRYWLHDRGPAPIGDMPVAVHVRPSTVRPARPGEAAEVRVTVACSSRAAAGRVSLDVPDGLTVSGPPHLDFDLDSGDYASWTLEVGGEPGVRYLAARITDHLGQTLEDAVAVAVGTDEVEPLSVALQTDAVRLPPGGTGSIVARLTNHVQSEMRGEAQLISPYGTWELIGPWCRGFAVPAGSSARLDYGVRVPSSARPGAAWWALVKIGSFGGLSYTEAVPIEVL